MSNIFLLVFLFVFLAVAYFFWNQNPSIEGFQTQIRFCPFDSTEFQTKQGNTDCCSGTVQESQCSSKAVCTLSPSHDGIPTCTQYIQNWLERKSKDICPANLPLYFAQLRNWPNRLPKGCTSSGNRSEDASVPLNPSLKRCTDYENEEADFGKLDSCLTEKEKLTVRCPSFPGFSSSVSPNLTPIDGTDKKVVLFYCQVLHPNNRWDFCIDDATLQKRAKFIGKKWENLQQEYKVNLCSTYKKVEIEKSEPDPRYEPEEVMKKIPASRRERFCKRVCTPE
jgi:hypothetical protein